MLGPIRRWWQHQSLRARITLITTVLFAFAVVTGALVLVIALRAALLHELDSASVKTAQQVAVLQRTNRLPRPFVAGGGGVEQVQLVDGNNRVVKAAYGTDQAKSLLSADELARVRTGHVVQIDPDPGISSVPLRVVGVNVGDETVVAAADLSRAEDYVRLLEKIAFVGSPIAVLLMGILTYSVVALALRAVAALRHSAEEITATELANQRLALGPAPDEIHRLGTTLNAMLDRIDTATTRQRTFVGDAAHELRSPLASLKLQLEIASRLGPATDWPEVVDDALVDVNRLERMVGDLLILARLDEGAAASLRREPVDLGGLVGGVIVNYEHARVPVRAHVDVAELSGDPDALRRVVVNLTDNAVRYAASAVDVHVEADGDTVLLTVTDDGRGIPAAERGRVFDRFYRVEYDRSRETGGTGLGLPIVRDLVRAHGGTIRLSDNPDAASGLRAVVRLPRTGVRVPDRG